MKSDKWPITVSGINYFVERTFSDEPAIYKVIDKDYCMHILGGGRWSISSIVARYEPYIVIVTTREDNGNEKVTIDNIDYFIEDTISVFFKPNTSTYLVCARKDEYE